MDVEFFTTSENTFSAIDEEIRILEGRPPEPRPEDYDEAIAALEEVEDEPKTDFEDFKEAIEDAEPGEVIRIEGYVEVEAPPATLNEPAPEDEDAADGAVPSSPTPSAASPVVRRGKQIVRGPDGLISYVIDVDIEDPEA